MFVYVYMCVCVCGYTQILYIYICYTYILQSRNESRVTIIIPDLASLNFNRMSAEVCLLKKKHFYAKIVFESLILFEIRWRLTVHGFWSVIKSMIRWHLPVHGFNHASGKSFCFDPWIVIAWQFGLSKKAICCSIDIYISMGMQV